MSTVARWGFLALLSAAALRPLHAQILSVPMEDAATARPVAVHASAGYFQTQNLFDGVSGLPWYLGDGWQYRVGADVGLRLGSFGASVTTANVAIQRGDGFASQGDIELRQYLATFRSPEPRGFGQVLEIGVGMSQWRNYRGTDALSGEDADPRNALALALGYGFVVPLGQRVGLALMQDYTTLVGSNKGLPAGTRRSQEQYTTRIGLRWRALGEGQ